MDRVDDLMFMSTMTPKLTRPDRSKAGGAL